MLRITVIVVAVSFLAGCNQGTAPTGLDPDRILHMAGQEAGQIGAARERLTRQLNIANRQNNYGRHADARATLMEARKTLESAPAKDLTDHQRLAGWISLSELFRAAEDRTAAGSALDQAIKYLNELLPVYARCEYVLGIAREARAQRGNKAAAAIIASSSDWVVEIPDQTNRRHALVSFTVELFRCEDYDAARKMLRGETDAAWRSDTLIVLADQARSEAMHARNAMFAADTARISPKATAESSIRQQAQQQYGKQLDFRNNYYRD